MKQETLLAEPVESQAIAVRPAESEATAVLAMIERVARDPTVDIARIEKLLEMRREIMADEARRQFAAALAAMQVELPSTERRGSVRVEKDGRLIRETPYALWEDINEDIKPVLARHGFAMTFRTGKDTGGVFVTGILSHAGGHREETTMFLPIDTTGSKNAVQAIGSSTSYGKRYTASALLNLTSRGEDDDGGAPSEPINELQLATLVDMLEDKGADKARFCKFMGIATLADLPASRYNEAHDAIAAKARK